MKLDPLKNRRIFVGFNHAGAAGIWQYTRVLRRRGYQIDFYGINSTQYNMSVDFLIPQFPGKVLSLVKRMMIFLKLLPRYDLWHLNYLECFFFYPLNLLILKLWGKKIVLTIRGGDVRQNGNKWQNWQKKVRLYIFCQFADRIALTGPFSADWISCYDKIIPYAREIKALQALGKSRQKKRLRVLHCPTVAKIKGTAAVETVFRRLRKKYPEVDFLVLQNLPREMLLKEMAESDIVIDQIIIGWYGGLAVEALAMGKTVLAYLDPRYFKLVDFAAEIPIGNTNAWTLERDVEILLNHPEIMKENCLKSERFAWKYHDRTNIAKQYLSLYREAFND